MSQQGNKFGAFKGVFTPSILTILGVIMYLRLPWIVGQAGLWATLGIVLVAHLISATTGLSVASIATDKKVETGGTYFMISRSLGLPIGGTLGLALFVGLSFSVSLYIIGFSETLLNAFGFEVTLNTIRLTGVVTLLAVTIITFISTSLALKAQFLILAVLILSLVSIALGQHDLAPKTPLSGASINSLPWIALFAIFFPAVTGFEAGVSMSGDLENPKKAIPHGTIMAIVVGLVVYIGLVFFFSYTVEREALVNDPAVLFNISLYSPLVVAGIWGATLSSALGSILGAPRILQATAIDRITPKVFAKGYGPSNEPRNALLLTFVIALAGILIGELNAIARVVSIFFIITYGFLNLTCAIENWAGSDFRPSFRIPAWISIIGALACFIVMIQLDFLAMIGATILLGAIFIFLKRRELKLQSGDTWGGFWSSLVKYGLLKLSVSDTKSQRNWRPNIILFSGNAKTRPHLIQMGRVLVGKQGVFTNFELIESSEENVSFDRSEVASVEVDNEGKEVITRKHICKHIYEGMETIARVYGFTGFEPNTILMGWGRKTRDPEKFCETVKNLNKLNYNLAIYNSKNQLKKPDYKTIDLWWNGNSRNLSFGIALLKYLTTDSSWRRSQVRVMVINYNSAKTDSIYALVNQILDNSRLIGTVKVINNSVEVLPEIDIIRSESSSASLAILELGLTKEKWIENTSQSIDLPCSTLLIEASKHFECIDAHTKLQGSLKPAEDESETDQPIISRIKFPEKEYLAEELKKISVRQEELHKNFVKNSVVNFEDLLTKHHKDLSNIVSKAFVSLEKPFIDGTNAERSQKTSKVLSEYAFQLKSKFSHFNDAIIEDAQKSIESSLNVYLQYSNEHIGSLPDRFNVKFSSAEFRVRAKDPLKVRGFKYRNRILGKLFGWPISKRIELSKSAELFLYGNRFEYLIEFFNQFGLATFRYASNVRRCLIDLAKSIEQERGNGVKDFEALKKAQEESVVMLSDAIEDFLTTNRKNVVALSSNLEQSIQRLCFVVGRPESKHLLAPYKKIVSAKHLSLTDIVSLPEIWAKNIKLYTNKKTLEFILVSLKHRFKIKLSKQVEELSRWTDSKLAATIFNVKDTLKNLNTTSELPDVSESIDRINELKNPAMQDRFELFLKDINEIVNELPEFVEVNNEEFFSEIDKGKFPKSEVRRVDLRRKAQFFIGTELISNARTAMELLSESLKETSSNLGNKLRLAVFNFENMVNSDDGSIDSADSKKLVDELLKDISAEELMIRKHLKKFDLDLNQYLHNSMVPLHQLVFSKVVEESKSRIKLFANFAPFKAVTSGSRAMAKLFNRQLVRILYSKSEGMMLAKRLTRFEQEHKISNQAIQEILVNLSGKEKVLKAIPFYYASLFSGSTTLNKELWVNRPQEQEQAEKIVSRYKAGYHGAMLITGKRNSGKSTLSKFVANSYLPNHTLHTVKAPKGGSSQKKDFDLALQKALNISVDPYHFINSTSQSKVIVINDLELWWGRHKDGLEVLGEIVRLIEMHGKKVFFIVNCGSIPYKLINKLMNLDAFFMGQVECQPFDAKELKDLVMHRHRTGGLKLSLHGKSEIALTQWNYAQLFNRYFNLSGGNPGYTLNAWLYNISKIVGKTIYIETPKTPNFSHLGGISDDLWLVIIQLILHRRISVERFAKVLMKSHSQVVTLLREMQRAGLVEERFSEVYAVSAILEPHLIAIMEERGLC